VSRHDLKPQKKCTEIQPIGRFSACRPNRDIWLHITWFCYVRLRRQESRDFYCGPNASRKPMTSHHVTSVNYLADLEKHCVILLRLKNRNFRLRVRSRDRLLRP